MGWNAVPPSIFSGPDAALWLEARRRFGAPPIPDAPDPYRPVGSKDSYTRYANCLTDAFRTAASTLASRVEVYGAKSAEVAEWLRGQGFAKVQSMKDITNCVVITGNIVQRQCRMRRCLTE